MSLLTSSRPTSTAVLPLIRSLRSGVDVLVTVARVRGGLSFGGLKSVRAAMLPDAVASSLDFWAARRVGKAIGLVSYLVPFASCLTQAQACQIVLARRGIQSVMFLGVRASGTSGLKAHAWLTVNGRLITGAGPDLARFRVIASFGPTR